jgi:hypothetical protein
MTNINPHPITSLPGTTITSADIVKFKQVCVKYYGSEPDDETALHLLERMVVQVENVYRPITKSQYEQYGRRENV